VLFHISEHSGIVEFIPRPSKYTEYPVVWAIDAARLRNYLVPRDCPRVTYYAGPQTTDADRERLLGSSAAVLAVEAKWWPRIRSCRLFSYRLPPGTFELMDEDAGYFVSRESVRPLEVEVIDDPITALLARDVELRIVPELDSLRAAVVASSLRFSIIRMGNAAGTQLTSQRKSCVV
jgi:hypothetical protein